MRPLAKTIQKNGFTFNQITRTPFYALYEQIDREGFLAGHEGFRIRIAKAGNVFDQDMPEREVYPADADFGVSAWSYGINLDVALAKFKDIGDKFKPVKPKK